MAQNTPAASRIRWSLSTTMGTITALSALRRRNSPRRPPALTEGLAGNHVRHLLASPYRRPRYGTEAAFCLPSDVARRWTTCVTVNAGDSGVRPAGQSMQQNTTKVLFNYWNDVRAGRLAPRRFDIEPAQISAVLPDTFMLERIASSIYRYRLAGTRICDQFQSEFRGVNFLDGWAPDDTETLNRDFTSMSEQGGAGLFTIEARNLSGGSVQFEVLVLPLVHTEGTIDRYLGSMSALEAPSWLGTERLVFKRLLRHEVIWPDGRPHAVVEMAYRQVPFLPHVRNARIVRQDRRQFRVYDGGLSKPEGEKF